jgi:dihydroorotate dehydrogenase electron transfer subunit
MEQIKVKIISNQRVSGNYWALEFESGLIAKTGLPGQFVNIRVADVFEPLLRRPVSIHGIGNKRVKILYEVLGKGTQILSGRKPGEYLDLIGPLGNGFDYSGEARSKSAKNILVAGGMGVAPLVFLAGKLKLSKPLVLIGGRTEKQILCLREFRAQGCQVKIATEDGSAGFKGRVTDLLKVVLEQIESPKLFSCGPRPMLEAVAQIACENKISAQLSLEEYMACGTGVCLGCVVQTIVGYKTVCKDGPVFASEEIIW